MTEKEFYDSMTTNQDASNKKFKGLGAKQENYYNDDSDHTLLKCKQLSLPC